MAELARMHGDKQIWLTRSHLAALASTTLFIAVLSFFVGLRIGQSRSTSPAAATAPLLLPDPAKEDALEALLRQVEVAQAEGASASDLTFPQALSAGEAPPTPTTALPSVTRESAVAPPAGLAAPTSGAIPPLPVQEGWSIQTFSFEDPAEAAAKVTLLSEAGWSAYQITALVHGQNWHRVRVGGYPNKEAAAKASAELAAGLGLEDLMIARAP
jgi:cell division septation protein DedD